MATKEQRAIWAANYAKKYPERIKAAKKKYRENNQGKIHAAYVKKYAAEKEKLDAQRKKWELENPDILSMQRARRRIRLMNSEHNRNLRYHYDVTLEKYNEVLAIQNGVCFICKQFNVTKRSGRLVVDHDHESGKLRGLLCHRCNCGLGYFKDSLDLIKRSIKYLEGFNACSDGDDWTDRVRSILENVPSPRSEKSSTDGLEQAQYGSAKEGNKRAPATLQKVG